MSEGVNVNGIVEGTKAMMNGKNHLEVAEDAWKLNEKMRKEFLEKLDKLNRTVSQSQ